MACSKYYDSLDAIIEFVVSLMGKTNYFSRDHMNSIFTLDREKIPVLCEIELSVNYFALGVMNGMKLIGTSKCDLNDIKYRARVCCLVIQCLFDREFAKNKDFSIVSKKVFGNLKILLELENSDSKEFIDGLIKLVTKLDFKQDITTLLTRCNVVIV